MTTEKIITEEQKKAAYALNMCMVSISQIIEYKDINIMEQEYEAILNNINLENISKDEELLDVLKQILNVITFFRIQDGDKAFIEKEYQHKMKNAIWSAIPSPTMLMTTSPAGLALSLAAMVGTGYMNYRRSKSENGLEYDRQMWQLQRAAIEQLNGLRRELFNASWKFAEKYNYPDELRLTERQIHQYNEILMDNNPIRKYQRLESIKDNFQAYPAFWYFFGNAANEIYMLSDPALIEARDAGKFSSLEFPNMGTILDEKGREYYLEKAREHFGKYWDINKAPLLREDQLACSCALEYADIIEDAGEKEELIDKARRFAGNSYDVLQLCAIAYLKLGKSAKAIDVLNILVNEDYNTEVNLQLLSSQYIRSYFTGADSNEKTRLKSEYELLPYRAPAGSQNCILKWPESIDDGFADYIETQKDMVSEKYRILVNEIEKRYVIKFYRLLPGPRANVEYDDSYFTASASAREKRKDEMATLFGMPDRLEEFRRMIQYNRIAFDYVDLYNEMMGVLSNLDALPYSAKEELEHKIEEDIRANANKLNGLQTKCIDGTFDEKAFADFISLTSKTSRKEYFDAVRTAVASRFDEIDRLDEISEIEAKIYDFCKMYDLPEPVLTAGKNIEKKKPKHSYFGIELLGEKAERTADRREKTQRIFDKIKEMSEAIATKKDVKWRFAGEKDFEEYFKKNKIAGISGDTSDVLAVLDDTSFSNYDIIFARSEIICVYDIDRKVQSEILYRNVKLEDGAIVFDVEGRKIKAYKNKSVDEKALYKLMSEINSIILEG